jgi:malto-oligosyltrehalose synthase/4-alpha-glucanotransferase
MLNLISTYRVQFHKDFSFKQLEKIIPYLQKLCVGTVYASPIFQCVPGSIHGYDGLNPNKINPEIGTLDQLKEISRQLKSADMFWLQDIVPNHMAFDCRNEWLMDVLEKGKESEYAEYFDIDWKEKLMIPFLECDVKDSIEKGVLTVVEENGRKYLKYYDSKYPLSKISSEKIEDVLESQHYRLCNWQETDSKINYRRFFTINGLICTNIQDDKVFEHYHSLVKELTHESIFDGLRIDHIDGLYDPTKYLQQLTEAVGEDIYVTVEKILQPGESLPKHWKAEGSTGYDFLSLVNNLFTQRISERIFTSFYQQLTNDYTPIQDHLLNKKALILNNHMKGELENLFHLFRESNIVDKRKFASIRIDDLKDAIAELLIHCPVYRFYGNKMPLDNNEVSALQNIFHNIRTNNPELNGAITLLEEALLKNPGHGNEERNERAAHFYKRLMQFTGPLMAKGVEDTLMYTYNSFIAHNEVGDQPSSFGITADDFHKAMQERQQHWPYSLNATATHDTKRGEDARARLNVLTNIADEWREKVNEWRKLNAQFSKDIDLNDEYFIYQALLGSYPLSKDHEQNFETRFHKYLEKVLREAKINSTWTSPNTEYENSVKSFASHLLNKQTPFWKSFEELLSKVIDFGIINSLSQVIFKFTCPGIPDIYQGCELWDLSFVDPDNRRPVDYSKRENLLNQITASDKDQLQLFEELWAKRKEGGIKLWLTFILLHLRKAEPELFTQGEYIPLKVEGQYKDNIIVFARKYRQIIYTVVLPLHLAEICKEQDTDLRKIDWKDTRFALPENTIAEWENAFLDEINLYKNQVAVTQLFSYMPFAILKGKVAEKNRSAGILLHITSLPSAFGIGDLGMEAKAFADFLHRANQRYWQLLPINPTSGEQCYSPYSAASAFAGYSLLISPEVLAKQSLLDTKDIENYKLENNGRTNYNEVEKKKIEILSKAYENFLSKETSKKDFNDFCLKESHWLDDYAMFNLLKSEYQQKPWHEWDKDLKLRKAGALKKFEVEKYEVLQEIKWIQFIFSQQWKSLKEYCNERNILLIGDLPIYVSYDSADVWANKEIFSLNENGNVTGVAGVPPDAFSDDGQLWGMPVFNWQKLKETNYKWWMERIKRNKELFDLIRIDHFRAFAEYWEVSAEDTTAKNGHWKPGPGSDFFEAVKLAIGELPFVAEDLGDVDDKVFSLRDEFNLPGMKVLQFAFDGDMPASVHIPHNHSKNFIVYTGTHDNNTTKGWFKEIDDDTRQRLNHFLGFEAREDNIHSILTRLAYSSVAKTVILPLQDILGLDETARMNIPASAENNWSWRLMPGQLSKEVEDMLKHLTWLYNR